jgi:small-conductance mechanosensitive channel/quercetin dioxygenase-like cupin family protein
VRTRRARLYVPFLLGVALLALYWVASDRGLLNAAGEKWLLFVATLPVIFFAVRLIDLFAFDFFGPRRRHVHAPLLLREIFAIVLYCLAFAWAISAIFHYSVTGFLATGTILAAVLGLALQETLGNLFSGIALHLEDTFDVGDVIRSGDHIGIVESVRWRGTRLRTFNNNIVVLPNSLLSRERLEVFPRNNLNARILSLGIDYNYAPSTVIAVLTQATVNVDGVMREMPCFARVAGFGDSSLTYEIKYFMRDYSQRDRIDADIRKAVWYALRRNGITIPFPIRSVQRYHPPAERLTVGAPEVLERLRGIDVLSPASPEAQERIAAAARVHSYSRGETIIRHGAAGDSMFVVHDGEVVVRIDGEDVARLKAGDFFGEMALLTGEARTADIVAATDVVAIEIAKHALQPVLVDEPELAASISQKVMERKDSLDSVRTKTGDEHKTTLARIRDWFGL